MLLFFENQSKLYTTLAHFTYQRPLRSEAKHPRSAMAACPAAARCSEMHRLVPARIAHGEHWQHFPALLLHQPGLVLAPRSELARLHRASRAASQVMGSRSRGRQGRELSERGDRLGRQLAGFHPIRGLPRLLLPLIGRLLDGNFAVLFIWRRTICKYKIQWCFTSAAEY